MTRITENSTRGKCLTALLGIVVLITTCVSMGCEQRHEIKHYVIGFVNPNPEEKEGAHGFLSNMKKNGYIEGGNVTYIRHETREKEDIESAFRDMVAKDVDLIFTITTPATRMAKKITEGTDIPVVFVLYNALNAGVVKSLANHGTNLTGVQLQGSTPKAIEWLLAIKPDTQHIFVPVCFDTGAAKHSLADLKQSAERAGLTVTVSEVTTAEELLASLSSMPKDAGAIFMLHSWLTGSHLEIIIDRLAQRRIPVVSAGHVDFEAGVLMSFGPIDDSVGSQAARLAHNILKGASPAHLPVENADYVLGINLRTARKLGVEVPDTVLKQADYIIR